MVLMESSLYRNSWEEFCAKFYPSHGIQFASIDIMKHQRQQKESSSQTQKNKNKSPALSLKSLEQNLAHDLDRLGEVAENLGDADFFIPDQPTMSTSAHSVLIARGPVQCLVAQYFLESSPLAGLVMVDPLLLPVDGRKGKKVGCLEKEEDNRWTTSLLDLIATLENRAPRSYNNDNESPSSPSTSMEGKTKIPDPPLLLPGGRTMQQHFDMINDTESTSLDLETSLLHSLACDKQVHSLKLEPGTVPILVLHSGGDHAYHDHYRLCSERTAAFHTCVGTGDYFDQVSVLKIPKKAKRGGSACDGEDDLDSTMRKIYEWYDEVVA